MASASRRRVQDLSRQALAGELRAGDPVPLPATAHCLKPAALGEPCDDDPGKPLDTWRAFCAAPGECVEGACRAPDPRACE